MKNLLVGIDFNDEVADSLINMAENIADRSKAKIWMLHVAAPNPDFVGFEPGPQFLRDQRADELKEESKQLNEMAAKLVTQGYNAEAILVQGPTIDTFLEESKKLDIDLIIMGYHPRGFIYNMFFTGTSEDIIRNAEIPVMVVPEPKA